MFIPSCSITCCTLFSEKSRPIISNTRAGSSCDGKSKRLRPSNSKRMATFGCANAKARTASTMAASSVLSVRIKFKRAGVFKNKSRISIFVPARGAAGRTVVAPPPSTRTSMPSSLPLKHVCMRKRDTEAIEGNASPRKPCDAMQCKSSDVSILLVAWRCSANSASAADMPQPLSSISMRFLPAPAIRTIILLAPASILFSINSFTADAGRSTTSPAAIWLATWGGKT